MDCCQHLSPAVCFLNRRSVIPINRIAKKESAKTNASAYLKNVSKAVFNPDVKVGFGLANKVVR